MFLVCNFGFYVLKRVYCSGYSQWFSVWVLGVGGDELNPAPDKNPTPRDRKGSLKCRHVSYKLGSIHVGEFGGRISVSLRNLPSHFLEALYLQRVGAPPHFLEEFGLGACALRLLVPLIKSCCFLLNIFELAFVVKEYEWLWTSFNTGFFNQPQSCSWILLVICLVRWWGWFMLVPARGFPLMPYHFLEILETVKYHANTKRDPQREHTASLEGKHTGRNTVLRKDV